MKTRFLTILLSVVLTVGCLPLSSSATDVYHLGDDTQLVDVGTSTVLPPEPLYLHSLASVSPLSTSSPTYWSSNDISNALKYLQNISSYTSKLGDTNSWLNAISTRIGTSNEYLKTLDKLYNQFVYSSSSASPSFANTLCNWLMNGFGNLANVITTSSDSLVAAFDGSFGFPDGFSFFEGKGSYFWDGYTVMSGAGSNRKLVHQNWYQAFNQIIQSVVLRNPGGKYPFLYSNGSTSDIDGSIFLVDASVSGFAGLASVLRGQSGNTIRGQLLNSSNLDGLPTDFWASDLLSSFKIFIPMQNDLARLTYVFADPTTIDLKKSQQGNEQAVKDNFTGDKGVNPDDIGSMSGMGDSLGGFVDTGVSMDDGFTQLNNGDTWNFFSQEVAGQLNTAPSTFAEDDDFIHFYDPENKAFQELLEQVRGGE